MAAATGSEKMVAIASAIQEGARAYLNRQYQAIGMVGVVICILLGIKLGAYVAVGFAIGDVTTGLLLEQRGLAPQFINAPEIYVIIGGEAERRVALADIQALRAAGFRVEYPFKELAFGKQFKVAAECGAKLALIYGGDEIAKGVVKIRAMVDRTEHEVPRDQLRAAVRDYLSGQ
ncbi:MAG: hypothetical protein EBT89_04020 [Opitutaceae bacterium]|nr:hypothetical protein [Opitutaceae bacterium]